MSRMPSTSILDRFSTYLTSQRNIVIFVSILIAVPIAYGFQATIGQGEQASGFLLLMMLAVGVPTTYNDHWSAYDRTWKAIGWVLVASVAVLLQFGALYAIGTMVLKVSTFAAAVGAFLITSLGDLLVRSRMAVASG